MNLIYKVLAQTNNSDWNRLGLSGTGNSIGSWQDLMSKVTNWVFTIAGAVAFFYLVYSGFIYLTAGGNPDAAKKGQQGILNAIIGLVIIVLAYAIVRAVVTFLT